MGKTIVLLTDWGEKSYYVGVVKGVIRKITPSIRVIDLTHAVQPYEVREAMHILARAYRDFSLGTAFVCVVDYGVGTERKALAWELESGYTLFGPDNGFVSAIVLHDPPVKIVELNNPRYFYLSPPSSTFHGRDIFAPAAAYFLQGIPLEKLGTPLTHYTTLPVSSAKIEQGILWGEVVFFDSFGNIETNIPARLFEEARFHEHKLVLLCGEKEYPLSSTSTYGLKKGILTVHPDSSGFLEISITQGNAQETLRIPCGTPIGIKPIDRK